MCEVLLPTSVANPSTILRSISATSEGDKSSAITMHGSRNSCSVLMLAMAQQIVHDARSHVAHVGGPLAQISVIDRAQGRRVFLHEFLESRLDVDFFGVNQVR